MLLACSIVGNMNEGVLLSSTSCDLRLSYFCSIASSTLPSFLASNFGSTQW